MGCLEEQDVVELFDEANDAARRACIEAHLAECGACREVVREYAAALPSVGVDAARPLEDDPEAIAALARRAAWAHAEKRVGTTLSGRWTLDRLIGLGGMAQVFAATHRNGRPAAIKVIRPELATEATLVQRFLREGYVANKVGHPGAVAILDDDVTPDGAPFLVMELLEGDTLARRLNDRGPERWTQALDLADRLLDVLAHAHDRGIVHRDIKPENLFLTTRGDLKVLDFGLARLRSGLGDGTQTKNGTTLGTLGFMSPEQARGAPSVDARADVWSVAATVVTLVSGKILHEAATVNESLLLSMTAPAPPVARLAPSVPASIAAVLDRALAFDPDERYPDARAFQAALQEATPRVDATAEEPEPLAVNELEPRPIRRYASRVALAVGVTVALVAAGMSARRLSPAVVGGAVPATATPAASLVVTSPAPSTSPSMEPPPGAAPSVASDVRETSSSAPAFTPPSKPRPAVPRHPRSQPAPEPSQAPPAASLDPLKSRR